MSGKGYHYLIKLTDEERALVELWSFNWFQTSGKPMKIPPRLYADLKDSGVDMKYFENDPLNESRGDVEEMRKAGLLWSPEQP